MRSRIGVPAWPCALAVALIAGSAACGGSSGSGSGTPTTVAPTGSEGPSGPLSGVEGPATVSIARPGSATTTTKPASLFEFVDYVVSGGLAGVTDHLKVYPDGRAVYENGSRVVNFTIPAPTIDELRRTLAAADLASLPPISGSRTPDAFAYRVIYGGQAVSYYDGAMPPALGPAAAILTREMTRAKQMR
ncbi:MAG: hypothetical protein LC733_01970 [Actinobacteria bacterium]|nr:hypothetical protein [Actinomycetota bacterium]